MKVPAPLPVGTSARWPAPTPGTCLKPQLDASRASVIPDGKYTQQSQPTQGGCQLFCSVTRFTWLTCNLIQRHKGWAQDYAKPDSVVNARYCLRVRQ